MDRQIRTEDDLLAIFFDACSSNQLLGVESEKFGVVTATGAPVRYDEGRESIRTIFDGLIEKFGWRELSEKPGAPVVALERIGRGGRVAQVTLEPGAQLELSGEALPDVHAIDAEGAEHLREVAAASEGLGLTFMATGFHPLARQEDLPWVPKDRYGIMREYFPTRGTRGLDMMRRTATVQVNLDFKSEADALRKFRVGMKLAPIATAMFANSPFVEGKATGRACERACVWLDADPDRTGLLPELWREGATFRDYANWALDVPMYLFKRDGKVFANTGQTFRSFWKDGFEGERPTLSDWKMHLATMFPETRLKTTLEMRSVDSQPMRTYAALAAFWAGILYDERSLAEADEFTASWTHEELLLARADIAARGIRASLGNVAVRTVAERVLDLASAGLRRRARMDAQGQDESRHLEALGSLVSKGQSPGDALLERVGPACERARIIEAARADG